MSSLLQGAFAMRPITLSMLLSEGSAYVVYGTQGVYCSCVVSAWRTTYSVTHPCNTDMYVHMYTVLLGTPGADCACIDACVIDACVIDAWQTTYLVTHLHDTDMYYRSHEMCINHSPTKTDRLDILSHMCALHISITRHTRCVLLTCPRQNDRLHVLYHTSVWCRCVLRSAYDS